VDRLADAVRGEVARLGPQAAIGRIAEVWPAAVGEQIARNAWPARIAHDGTLHVHTSSSTWAFELAQLAVEIRARLGDLAPTRVRFAPGPLPEPETPAARRPDHDPPPHPTAADIAAAAAATSRIGDETFRKLVARAAAASLAKARSGRAV
jgi:hypothetical protein